MEERVAEAMAKLGELRAHYEEEDGDEGEDAHFYYRIQGGQWTEKVRGMFRDGVACYARSHARDWCAAYGWPRQKGFSTSKYGENTCVQLSREWVRPGNHYCQIWFDHDCDPGFRYLEEHSALYEENPEWLDWACAQDVAGEVFPKVMEARNFRPRAVADG